MSTLQNLQSDMASQDGAAKQAATKTLADYYYVYNEEYNAVLTSKEKADAELFQATHNETGVNMPLVLRLRSLILGLQSRQTKLDEKMLAFHSSQLSIQPPDQPTIDQVKALSAEVSQMQLKDTFIDKAADLLTQIATLTGKIQGA
jgi:hypothetical protein